MTRFSAGKSSTHVHPYLKFFLIALPLWLLVRGATAEPGLGLRLDSISGSGWSAQGIEIKIELQALTESKLSLEIDKVSLFEQAQDIRDIRLECSALKIEADALSCKKAVARLGHTLITPKPFPVTFDYHFKGLITGSFRELPLARGILSGRFSWQPAQWFFSTQGTGLDLQELTMVLGEQNREHRFRAEG